MTVDGHKAWDIVDIRYQLSLDPGKDIPYMACFFTQPKDGNHGPSTAGRTTRWVWPPCATTASRI